MSEVVPVRSFSIPRGLSLKFGIASQLLWSYPLSEAIHIAELLGYEAIEVWAEHYRRDSCKKLRRSIDHSPLIFTLHAFSYDINITSSNRRIRRESIRQSLQSLTYASEIGSGCVVLHPGRLSSPKHLPDEYWEIQIDSLTEIVNKAEEFRMDVYMEIMDPQKKEIVITPETANAIYRAISKNNFGITFDAAHAQLTGDPVAYIKKLDNISHVHLSDSTTGNTHCLLGRGNLNVMRVLTELKKRYKGLVVVEGWDPRDELGMVTKTMDILRGIRKKLFKL